MVAGAGGDRPLPAGRRRRRRRDAADERAPRGAPGARGRARRGRPQQGRPRRPRAARARRRASSGELLPGRPIVDHRAPPPARGSSGSATAIAAEAAAVAPSARLAATKAGRPPTALLHVDRSFTIAGAGTVVTGTVAAGGFDAGARVTSCRPGRRPGCARSRSTAAGRIRGPWQAGGAQPGRDRPRRGPARLGDQHRPGDAEPQLPARRAPARPARRPVGSRDACRSTRAPGTPPLASSRSAPGSRSCGSRRH